MKNLLLAITLVSAFGACSSKKEIETKPELLPINNAGYIMSNSSTDISKSENEKPVAEKQLSHTRIIYVPVEREKQYVPRKVETVSSEPVAKQASVPATTVDQTSPQTQSVPSSGNNDGIGNGNARATPNIETPETTKKKGWSDAAKGAVIGGAAGAVGGAIINGKNRGKGAVIGAVLGAAGGYVIGRKRDKNSAEANPYSMVVN